MPVRSVLISVCTGPTLIMSLPPRFTLGSSVTLAVKRMSGEVAVSLPCSPLPWIEVVTVPLGAGFAVILTCNMLASRPGVTDGSVDWRCTDRRLAMTRATARLPRCACMRITACSRVTLSMRASLGGVSFGSEAPPLSIAAWTASACASPALSCASAGGSLATGRSCSALAGCVPLDMTHLSGAWHLLASMRHRLH